MNKGASAIVWAFLLGSCNTEVFVEPLMKDASPIELGVGDSLAIPFNRSDWEIQGVGIQETSGSIRTCYGKIYDAEGTLIDNHVPLYSKGLSTLVYQDYWNLQQCTFCRSRGDALWVKNEESLCDSVSEFVLLVGNEDIVESQFLKVRMLPGEKYKVDSIVYDCSDAFSQTNTVEIMQEMTIDNSQSDQPLRRSFYPYKERKRQYEVRPKEYGEPVAQAWGGIDFPVLDVQNDSLLMTDETMPYVGEEQIALPLYIPDADTVRVYVTVPPRSRYTYAIGLNMVVWGEVRFTVYGTHPVTHRKRTFQGTLRGEYPYDARVYRLKYKEEKGEDVSK